MDKNLTRLQYLTFNEIYFQLDEEYIKQICNSNPQIVIHAEQDAISTIVNYLYYQYDLDKEFRPIQSYELSKEFEDYARVKFKYVQSQIDFGTTWNVDLINSNFAEEDFQVLVKKPNTPEPQYLTEYESTYSQNYLGIGGNKNAHNYEAGTYKVTNPNYNPSQGLLSYGTTGETLQINRIVNPYSVTYNPDYTISNIDFSTCGLTDVNNIIGNAQHFKQYSLSDFLTDDRNHTIKTFCIDLVIYFILQRSATHDMSTNRQARYDKVIESLEKISKGFMWLPLPKKKIDDANQNTTGFRFGQSYLGAIWDY